MKTLISKIKKVRPAVLIGMLALFIAVGGTATAASGLINGKKIKKGTVTSKQIKNKTITSGKLAPSTIAALKGAQGARGEKGAKGDRGEKGNPGAKGDTGAPGVAGPETVTSFTIENSDNIAANTDSDVVAFNNMDSGKYLFLVKTIITSNAGGSFMRCAIDTNNNGGGDEAQWTSTGAVTRTTVPMILSTSTNITQAIVNCEAGTSAGSFAVHAIAIPIG